MRVEPLGDKVVIKRLAPEEKTAGGIVRLENLVDEPRTAEDVEGVPVERDGRFATIDELGTA